MPDADADVIVIGAGVIGLSIARALLRRGLTVALFDQAAAGREASWAAAGMLAAFQTSDPVLRPLALASARLYPDWAAELERETYLEIGWRPHGTVWIGGAGHLPPDPPLPGWEPLSLDQVRALEPALHGEVPAFLIAGDHSVDNRLLLQALLASLRARGVPIHEHCPVTAAQPVGDAWEITAGAGRFRSRFVVNAAGAWSTPCRPVKGHMLRLRGPDSSPVSRVIAAPGVYIVPRAAGRTVIGSTLEDVGFDRDLDSATVAALRRRAAEWVPALERAQMEEAWTGFRPRGPDALPLIGPAAPNYWFATGHFRDGILLAPITAQLVADALTGQDPAFDLGPFHPRRCGCLSATSPAP